MRVRRHTPRQKRDRSEAAGFTLNELLVSSVIFIILATLVIANFRQGQYADDLRISAQTLESHFRRVQNLATAGQALSSGEVPRGGYGVNIPFFLDANQYLLFADIASFSGTACDPTAANSEYDPACDPLTPEGAVLLKPGVVLSRITVGNPPIDITIPSDVDITFRPPKPIPLLDGVSGKSVSFELKHTKTNDYRTITIIGASGQISERIGQI